MDFALKKTIKLFLLLFFISCFVSVDNSIANKQERTRFPGAVNQLHAPATNYVLINVDSESEEQAISLGGNHVLYYKKNSKAKLQKKLYSYCRYVEALWSPKGNMLLINDYAGSNYSIPIIFLIDNNKFIDVREQFRKKMGDTLKKKIFGNHHVFFIGTEWLSEKSLKVQIYGYGDNAPEGFIFWYKYLVGEGFSKLE